MPTQQRERQQQWYVLSWTRGWKAERMSESIAPCAMVWLVGRCFAGSGYKKRVRGPRRMVGNDGGRMMRWRLLVRLAPWQGGRVVVSLVCTAILKWHALDALE